MSKKTGFRNTVRQREGYAPPTSFCNDAPGNLLVNIDILSRWGEYFAEHLGEEIGRPAPSTLDILTGEENLQIPPPMTDEINAAIGKLKTNKSPGSDGIQAELLKHAGDSFVDHLFQLFQKIWTTFERSSYLM